MAICDSLSTCFLWVCAPVQRFISQDKLPHLLFYGPPGTGKTSTILACARQLYKEKEFNSMVLEVNPALRFNL